MSMYGTTSQVKSSQDVFISRIYKTIQAKDYSKAINEDITKQRRSYNNNERVVIKSQEGLKSHGCKYIIMRKECGKNTSIG